MINWMALKVLPFDLILYQQFCPEFRLNGKEHFVSRSSNNRRAGSEVGSHGAARSRMRRTLQREA